MEYLDTKVLESLMIPEETEIATESINIKNVLTTILNFLKTAVNTMIKLVNKFIMAIKTKLKSKTSSDSSAKGKHLSESDFIPVLSGGETTANCIQALITEVYISRSGVNGDKIAQLVSTIKASVSRADAGAEKMLNKTYGSDVYYINDKVAEKVLTKLFNLKEGYEKASDKLTELGKAALDAVMSHPEDREGYDNTLENVGYFKDNIFKMVKIFEKTQKIIINATYDYGHDSVIDTRVVNK